MSEADRIALEPGRAPVTDRARTSPGSSVLTPMQLSEWLDEHGPAIVERWLLEVRARSHEVDGPLAELLSEFLALMVAFLPPAMGPWKDHVKPLFQQSAELYGNLAAIRGLAAGEAVEELQFLREVLFRFLHAHPPHGIEGGVVANLGLRELLQLNRIVDEGVTYASVGHMDTLFFNLLHGTGVTHEPEGTVLDEIRNQVESLTEELAEVQPLADVGDAPPAN